MKGFWRRLTCTDFACVQYSSRVSFSHLRKTVHKKKMHVCTLPWNLLHFREREKVAETFRQCTFSLDKLSLINCRRWDFGPGDCSGGLQGAENGLRLPVVHICWCTLGALLFARPPENPPQLSHQNRNFPRSGSSVQIRQFPGISRPTPISGIRVPQGDILKGDILKGVI